ncbi:MAG: RluA family pseudouridine synthase [Candidatus Saccharimonadales bacterium]
MKAENNEIKAVLRQYGLADEGSSRRAISQVKELDPQFASRLVSFYYENVKYFLIYDDTAEDDEANILAELRKDQPHLKGALVQNPHDDQLSYGTRFKGKEIYLFAVAPLKRRLDHELAERYPNLSRSTIQKYIKAGYVTVNGEEITQVRRDVFDADDIAMTPPEATDFSAQEIPIIFIDDNVIVINKPAGVLSHSKGALNDEFTVAEFFRRYTTDGLESSRPGIVHRLDRDTSGVMIGARNEETAVLLKKQFADRKTKKEYVAVVEGIPKVLNAVIDLPIGRNPATPSQFRVDASGKDAVTTYEVIAMNEKQSLVKFWPKTGRTHQLRVHAEYINIPIVGDRVYGDSKKADRLYLHAHTLEITIPTSDRRVFTAPVPPEFTEHFPGVGNV